MHARTFIVVIVVAMIGAGMAEPVLGQPTRAFSFQGELHDPGGSPVADGSYDIIFRLYTASAGGSEIWQQSISVDVLDGRFGVILGSGIPLPQIDRPLWLGIAVGRDTEMTPRTQILGVPYSLGLATPLVTQATGGSDGLTVDKTSSTGGSAVRGTTDGPGFGLYGHSLGLGVAVAGFSEGIGQAGWFEVQNPESDEEAVFARTNGVGAAIAGQHEGAAGNAGWFGILNPGNTSNALYGQTPGSGAAVSGKATGAGVGIHGQNTGNGLAGLIHVTNNSSSSPALVASTVGLGNAASFSNDNVNNTSNVLSLNSYGSGSLLVASKSLVPQFIIENDGTVKLYNAGVAVITLDKDFNGDGRVITEEIEITGGSDVSELFNVDESYGDVDAAEVLPGMLVSVGTDGSGNVRVSTTPYDATIVGVVSGAGGIETGFTMGQRGSVADGECPVAIAGRVYVLADASSGPIEPGDLLTSSSVPGHAMKASNRSRAFGATVGKALTPLEEGRGLVLMLVSLH